MQTIEWRKNSIKFIDQSQLPRQLKYVYIKDVGRLWKAIKSLRIRGAPVLGAAAALGVYLGVKSFKTKNFNLFFNQLSKVCCYIGSSRPTARNLFFALERMQNVALNNKGKSIDEIKQLLLEEAKGIIEEDRLACRKIGDFGARLIKDRDNVLTICNAGILATIDYGTALGTVYSAKKQGKKIKVYVCETRPMLQGARLTTWELKNRGIDVTLICDSMAATLMKKGKIDKVIIGADRIALNGDVANKIGSYNLAVLCDYHKIPFYVTAPISTFDFRIKSGKEITIEERNPEEVTFLFFKKPITAEGVKVFNPAFDITPHNLITAIVTEKGIIKPPYGKNINKLKAMYASYF
ncbi:MAG: S-methyl-5-thioribose-1-phosphate isomerase [Candidatus Omnitrophica bacterium]|nr:S-methyl-5-thioribose-1-phosphate isomerase [Candidatus Omnitrophota bacterium]